uniref:Uncharacterized protein n=1 Tax=Oryza sativa subsp. japonica TaxID=39947 RepID=Q84Q41_ORYSJ|nr:hypothetical protein [Oryza sativa Japonica Group]
MAAPSSLASSHLIDLHRAGGASPSPLPRCIRSNSASGALAATRSASSPWPDPARLPSSFLLKPVIQASDAVLEAASELGQLLGHGDGGEAVNGVIVRADQPQLAAGGGVAGEEGVSSVKPDDSRHDTDEDHDTFQVSHDPPKVSLMKPGDSYHVSGDTCEVSDDIYQSVILARYQVLIPSWYRVIPTRYRAISTSIRVILGRYHMILTKYRSWASRRRGIVADGRVLPRPRSTLNPNLIAGSRILPRPWSTSELVASDRVLRRDLVTCGHVHRPRLSRWLHPPRRSSSPVPPPSPRRILRRARPTPKLVAGAVSVTMQDPPPSMRPCPMPELASGRVLHAGARRRQPRPPRQSSVAAVAVASAPPTSASSMLLPWWPSFSRLREVDRERSRWDSIPTGYRYIAAPKSKAQIVKACPIEHEYS